MNGEVNCILQVCCPAGSEEQKNALAREMSKALSCSVYEARAYADWVLEHFDLAEKDTLVPFKRSIARLARQARTVDGAEPGS